MEILACLSVTSSKGLNHFNFTLNPGSVDHASGKIPLVGQSGAIAVAWEKTEPDQIAYEIESPHPIWIHLAPSLKPIPVQDRARLIFKRVDGMWSLAAL